MIYTLQHPKLGRVDFKTRRGLTSIKYSFTANLLTVTGPPEAYTRMIQLSPELIQEILEKRTTLQHTPEDYIIKEDEPYECYNFKLMFRRIKNPLILRWSTEFTLDRKFLYIYFPTNIDFSAPEHQDSALYLSRSVLSRMARTFLLDKAQEVSTRLGVHPIKFKITQAKRSWGSCSSRGTISLSCHMMFLNEVQREAVICHELAHLTYMNHSEDFYELLEHYCPNYHAIHATYKRLNNPILMGH